MYVASQFENPLLEGLNQSQQKAVLTTEGRVLVLAGAGSGKTKVLTTRISYLIQQGVDPWRILAITFTNKSAKEMKERASMLEKHAFKCWIGTFHSVCNRILQQNIHQLGMEKFTLMDESDQKAIMKTAAAALGLDVDKKLLYQIASQISLWKNEGVVPGEAQSMMQGDRDKLSIAQVYEQYEDQKAVHFYFDYDDLLLKTIQLFRNSPELLGKYQNIFKYILVDEFQDSNKIQFELIEMLGKKHGNIFLVGDSDQSIYSFRSAKVENILQYQNLYPETQLITLEENYRSTQMIVNASNSLVEKNKMRLERTARSMGDAGSNIHVFRFNDASREADFVARLIANIRKKEKKDWKDFAVLYRMNSQSKHLELALRDENIPYKIVGSIAFHERKEIKDIVYYLRACHNLADDYAIEKIINVPKRGIGETTVKKVQLFANERKIPLIVALKNIEDVSTQSKISPKTRAAIKEFVSLMEDLSEESRRENFLASTFLRIVLQKTNFMGQFNIEKEEDEARIENVTYMRNYAKQWDLQDKEDSSLSQFLTEINLDGEEEYDEDDYVVLSSIHSAKGLEWKTTFIIGMEDDIFPHYKAKMNPADMEEERRLMYVAMTRAKEYLFITYSAYKYEYNSQRPIKQKPSPFLDEIPPEFKEVYVQTA